MGIFQSFVLAIKSLLNNKMRAFLTMLGIIIGVGSVILIMSLGNGVTNEVNNAFESMGARTITVTLTGRGSTRAFTEEDMFECVEKNRSTIPAFSPEVSVSMVSVRPKGWNENLSTKVTGVGEEYLDVKSYDVEKGRFFSYVDCAARQKVCFVGAYLDSAEVYGGNALGNTIKINGEAYTIVGVCSEITDANSDSGSDNFVYIPYTTAMRKLTRTSTVSTYSLVAADDDSVQPAKQILTNALYRVYEDENAYNILALADIMDIATGVMDTMVIVIACIAGISLLVGGIGIMNIMLVSVTERTRDIGIRKALGAKRADIKIQFVIEAMTTSLIGGILGIVVGVVSAQNVGPLLEINAVPSFGSVALSVGISVFIGVLFGYLPAKKASELNPIDALRHE